VGWRAGAVDGYGAERRVADMVPIEVEPVLARAPVDAVPLWASKRARGERCRSAPAYTPTSVAAPRAREVWRSGLTRTTSQTRPARSSSRITTAEGSGSKRRSPWAAEVGKA
jgi:hypothetical protein